MKKFKMPPEQYRTTLKDLEITSINLIRSNLSYDKAKITQGLVLDLKERAKFQDTTNQLNSVYSYTLSAKNKDTNEVVISIKASFDILFSKASSSILDIEFLKIFESVNLAFIAWPYFREFVQNSIARLGLPPLTLPMKKTQAQ